MNTSYWYRHVLMSGKRKKIRERKNRTYREFSTHKAEKYVATNERYRYDVSRKSSDYYGEEERWY